MTEPVPATTRSEPDPRGQQRSRPRSSRPLSDEDLPGLVALSEAVLATDGGLPLAATESFLRRRFLTDGQSEGTFDGDRLVAAAGLRPVGGVNAGTALIHPAARGQGHGAARLDWLIVHGGPTVRIETESLTQGAEELFASRGLQQTFAEDVMRCDLAAAPPWPAWPSGLTLATWDTVDATRFFQTYQESFRTRPGFPGWTQEQWVDWHTGDDDFAPEWTLLATTTGGHDVGFIACAHGPWVVQVGVAPGARGRGLGAALTAEALRRMAAAGQTAVLLDVNVNNPGAARVYERLGFVRIGRRARYERPAG